ncbi:MAG: pilin [Patescibacteria group bacterium]|jgi:hypothetical protein
MGFFFGQGIKLRPRQAILGLASGVQLGVMAVIFLLPLLLPVAALGQGAAPDPGILDQAMKESRCFQLIECNKDMLDQTLCTNSPQNCCLGDRCFERNTACGSGSGKTASGFCFAKSPPFQLAVSFGGTNTVVDLSDYIVRVYKFAIGIAAILAAVMMMVGGFLYLTAADSGRVSRGKEYIVDALTGLVVAFSAFLLLNTVNPDTVSLALPKIPVVKKQAYVGCTLTDYCAGCGLEYGITQAFIDDLSAGLTGQGAFKGEGSNKVFCSPDYILTNISSGSGYVAKCVGKVCDPSLYRSGSAPPATCNMNLHSCQKPAAPTDVPACGTEVAQAIKLASLPAGSPPPAPDQQYPAWFCRSCNPLGSACSPTGQNPRCCGGYCGQGGCTTGQPGDACNDNKDCASNICQTNWGNSCSEGLVGAPCTNDKECRAGFKCNTANKNVCTPGNKFSKCSSDSECNTGFCNTGLGICVNSPSEALVRPSSTCSNAECSRLTGGVLNYCSSQISRCTDGSDGSPCGRESDCASGRCVALAGIRICTSGESGSACDNDSDCISGHCFTEGDFNVCTTGGPGSRCNNAEGCNQDSRLRMDCLGNRCVFRTGT